MKKLIVLLALTITGCQSNIGDTCTKFGMDTEKVEVVSLDHDIQGKGFTQTRFTCKPKIKLKR